MTSYKKPFPFKPLIKRFIKKVNFITQFGLYSLFAGNAFSQQVISLDLAIQKAVQNNLAIRSERLQSNFKRSLVRASANIPQANLNAELGQFNSIYRDNRFGIQQSIEFPTVYSYQKALATKQWEGSLMNVRLKEIELIKRVELVYLELMIALEKQKVLQQADSLYSEFIKKSSLRLEKGDANILEKVTAESQAKRIKQQLIFLQQTILELTIHLQFLLNTDEILVPDTSSMFYKLRGQIDTAGYLAHPSLGIIENQKTMANIEKKIERSKLLPDFMAGYSSTTIRGIGADDIFYSSSQRFNSAQFGIGIPLFFGSQKSKINASKIQQEIAANQLLEKAAEMRGQLKSLIQKYKICNDRLDYYVQTGLPNSETIIETANLQFSMGQIGYLDWVLLMNQSFEIKNEFTDALREFNQTVLEINYITSK